MNYERVSELVTGFSRIINLSSIAPPPQIPASLILVGVPQRSGLSAIKLASRVIARKAELGLPVGALPTGEPSPDEQMIRIMFEELVKALQEEAIISVGIPPGITLAATGLSPSGPVSVFGSTLTPSKGFGIIQ